MAWPGSTTQLTQRSNSIAEEYSSAHAMLAPTGWAYMHAEGPKRGQRGRSVCQHAMPWSTPQHKHGTIPY